ncbi:DUF3326 domain-containing protein [bacterium]|nr:DUF3326 domain-containing protein [bacterium]
MIGNEKLGIFIVPTGIGASIGGYAGDAAAYAREFSKYAKLIVNPNVVNAGGFSGINDNMLYVEGYSLDEFVKGNINLLPSDTPNKVGIIFDKSIPEDVLNVHLNTMNAVKVVYGVNVSEYVITEEPIGIEFTLNDSGVSDGAVKNPNTMLLAAKKLLKKGCNAIAIVGMFDDPEDINEDYANGEGTDPVGGVEAILSHCISKELKVPCAHSPAFEDYQIHSDIVNPKSASEYITPTFLPCILLGLSQAPLLVQNGGISVKDVDFLAMPYNSLGSPAVFAAIEQGIKIYAVKENKTALNVTAELLGISNKICTVNTYAECLNLIKQG